MSGTQETSNANVEDTVRDFWRNRPIRPFRGRVVAGVAAGIGRRYGLDPTIVRVLLAVSTFFGGIGLLFYLIGWLILPREGDRGAAIENFAHAGRSSVSIGFSLILLCLLFPVLAISVASNITAALGAVVVFGGFYLLHHSRAGYVPPAAPPTQDIRSDIRTGDIRTGMEVGSMTTPTSAHGQPGPDQPVPPKWDPLGAAPFAWDLPEPAPAEEPEPPAPAPRRRKSRIGLATIGVMIMVGGVLGGFSSQDSWFDVQNIVGVLLGVLGVGLVVGSFLRAGRGLIWLAILMCGAGVLITHNHDDWVPSGHIGFESFAPKSVDDVRVRYPTELAGNVDIDLRALTATDDTDRTVVRTGIVDYAGNIRVEVPANAVVRGICGSTRGHYRCLGDSGENALDSMRADIPPGTPGLTIDLDVRDYAGNVEVTRG